MKDALYFPIHRAKKGEITGVGHLSPRTRTRVRPTFVKAMSILRKFSGNKEIVLEEDAPELAARLAREVESHTRH